MRRAVMSLWNLDDELHAILCDGAAVWFGGQSSALGNERRWGRSGARVLNYALEVTKSEMSDDAVWYLIRNLLIQWLALSVHQNLEDTFLWYPVTADRGPSNIEDTKKILNTYALVGKQFEPLYEILASIKKKIVSPASSASSETDSASS
jgi:hypothetical protein